MFLKLKESGASLWAQAESVSQDRRLAETGADRVVSLDAGPVVTNGRCWQIELEVRAFSAEDLDGAFLTIVATIRTLNEALVAGAAARRACNVRRSRSVTSFIPL
jgi:hypothetical protein